ncbi:MAG: hypothetical protein IKN63_06825 [Bacilli bacterium]|nr:hypothetical protein [Bacilli bacterium]
MEKNAEIKYFCCEDQIIVRVIAELDNYTDSLEYYDPRVGGWIPSREWYQDMFVDKVVNFKEINKSEALKYIESSIKYYKRMVSSPIYLRQIYGLDLEFLNNKTGEWQTVLNHDWYDELDDYEKVSKEKVLEYKNNLFRKNK